MAIPPLPQQLRAQQHPLLIVHAQEEDGPATHRRERDDLRSSKLEVRAPALDTGIEQHDHLAGLRIARSNVGPLKAITTEAGIGEIVERGLPSMLLTDDVIRLMRRKGSLIGETTVFAAVFRPRDDSAAQSHRERGHAHSAEAGEPWTRARISERMSSSRTI